MKKLLIVPALALIALFIAPTDSFALSCMESSGMFKNYTEESQYTVVTATPKENIEHVKEKAAKDDPNKMYDSGFTAQRIEVSVAHKGHAPDSQWVYFTRNATWNYLCVSGPAPIGEASVYVIHNEGGLFEMSNVAAVYPADSQLAKNLLKAVKKANTDSENPETPEVFKADKTYWLQQLHDELKDMAFLLKVKLAEWNFWQGNK